MNRTSDVCDFYKGRGDWQEVFKVVLQKPFFQSENVA